MSGTVALVLSITSGFVLLGYRLGPASMIATSIIIDLALAPVTTVVAFQHKRPVMIWAIMGLAFGAWALAAILMLVRLRRATEPTPLHPDAA